MNKGLNDKKVLRDKINKFRLKHKIINKIVHILLMVIIIIFCIAIFNLFIANQINLIISNSNIVVVLAAILGSVVGGIITYYINRRTMLQSNHIKTSIINKKVIYEPLLMEYKTILKELCENKNILRFSYDSRYNFIGSTSYQIWLRIKNDIRYYQIPDYYKKECIELEYDIDKYDKLVNNIIKTAFNIFEILLNEKGYVIDKNQSGILSFINPNDILDGKNILRDKLLKDKIAGIPSIEEKDKDDIYNKFELKLVESTVVFEFKKAKQELINSLKEVIETTEMIIIAIAKTFETRNNIY